MPAPHRPYDDDFDDEPPGEIQGRPTMAGMYGFLFALIALGLLGVVAILWFLLRQENQLQLDERTRRMFFWFLFLDVVSFIGALIATILGARGVAPDNPLHRGFSLAAIILGIIELVVTAIFGLIFFCCSLFIEIIRGGGG